MITQKDVAERAGVSFITVSRVVNNEANVKEETRINVLKAIEELGYSPTFAGQALNSGRCNTIAVLTPLTLIENMRAFYLTSILHGIESVCAKNKIDVMLAQVPEVDSSENDFDYLRPYRQKKVDGIIYVGMKKIPDDMLKELALRRLPCVVIGDRSESDLVSWVDTDNYNAGYNTVKKIWEKGHRRIAFLGLEREIYNANVSDRERGFVQALKDLGAEYDPEKYIIRAKFDGDTVTQSVRKFFAESKLRPSAIFCSVDTAVPFAVLALEEIGLSVPKDVSIVGFDGYINFTYYKMRVATNPQPLISMGEKSAEILLRHIADKNAKKEEFVFQVPFEDGESLASVN